MEVLLYNLEQGITEDQIIEQCRLTGKKLPKAIANAPELLPGLDIFIEAFYALSSCRPLGFGGEGQIPWSAIEHYCTVNEIDGFLKEELYHHVRKLDGVYLKHCARKTESKKPSVKSSKLRPQNL